jgi:hypothetical protein
MPMIARISQRRRLPVSVEVVDMSYSLRSLQTIGLLYSE